MEKEKDFLRPINNTSIVQRVIDRLTKAMIHKELRPGDKIPTEMELAASFGVGRNSVREAIKILTSFGVLEIRRPEGTFVVEGFSNRMLDPLLYGIILNESDSIESLKELREWMDWGILNLAVTKSEEEDIKLIEERLEALKTALSRQDVEEILAADNNFHLALADATHNPLFVQMADLVRKLTSDMQLRTLQNMMKLNKLDEMGIVHEKLYQIVKDRCANPSKKMIEDSYFYHYDVLKD